MSTSLSPTLSDLLNESVCRDCTVSTLNLSTDRDSSYEKSEVVQMTLRVCPLYWLHFREIFTFIEHLR